MQTLTVTPQRLPYFILALSRTLTENMKVFIAGAVSVSLLSLAVLLTMLQEFPGCEAGQTLLVYPLYDQMGIVYDTRSFCGVPHRGCMPRSVDVSVQDCSPFMAPKGSVTLFR